MAIKLQKYERQVGPSSEAGGVTGSMEVAGSGWGAVGQAARAVGQVGGVLREYGERQQKAQYTSDIANYKGATDGLKTEIELAKNEFLKNPGNKFEDMHEKVVVPMLNDFESSASESGYSADAMEAIQGDWGVERQKIESASIAEIETRRNANYLEGNKQGYYRSKQTGDEEEAAIYLEQIRNLSGDKVANEIVQLGEYNRDINELARLNDIEEINNFKPTSTRPDHVAVIETEKVNLMRRIASEAQTLYVGGLRTFANNASKGEATTQQVNAVAEAGGNPRTIESMNKALLAVSAEDNPKAKKSGLKLVDDYKDGSNSLTLDKGVQKIMDLNLTLTTKSQMVQDMIDASEVLGEKSNSINIGSGIYGTLPGSSLTSKTTSGFKTVAEQDAYRDLNVAVEGALALARNEDDYAKIVDEFVDARKELKKLSKEGLTSADWDANRSAITGRFGSYSTRQINAPQIKPRGGNEVERITADGKTAIYDGQTKEFLRYK